VSCADDWDDHGSNLEDVEGQVKGFHKEGTSFEFQVCCTNCKALDASRHPENLECKDCLSVAAMR